MDAEKGRPRGRIITAATALLTEHGRDAVTTRAVAAAAGVQPPTIYRQFGDMRGLLDAVASHGFEAYLAVDSAAVAHDDPVDVLRVGWDRHVAFGLAQPAMYALMFGEPAAPLATEAAARSADVLAASIAGIARAGRLRVSEDIADAMVRATGVGTVLQLLSSPPERRPPGLSHAIREAVLAAITTSDHDSTEDDSNPALRHALALRSLLDTDDSNEQSPANRLSPAEAAMLREWLSRLAEPSALFRRRHGSTRGMRGAGRRATAYPAQSREGSDP